MSIGPLLRQEYCYESKIKLEWFSLNDQPKQPESKIAFKAEMILFIMSFVGNLPKIPITFQLFERERENDNVKTAG